MATPAAQGTSPRSMAELQRDEPARASAKETDGVRVTRACGLRFDVGHIAGGYRGEQTHSGVEGKSCVAAASLASVGACACVRHV